MPTHKTRLLWTFVILIICFVALFVPFYNRIEPAWLGIPFFYYFQFGWIIVSAIVTALAYRAGL